MVTGVAVEASASVEATSGGGLRRRHSAAVCGAKCVPGHTRPIDTSAPHESVLRSVAQRHVIRESVCRHQCSGALLVILPVLLVRSPAIAVRAHPLALHRSSLICHEPPRRNAPSTGRSLRGDLAQSLCFPSVARPRVCMWRRAAARTCCRIRGFSSGEAATTVRVASLFPSALEAECRSVHRPTCGT